MLISLSDYNFNVFPDYNDFYMDFNKLYVGFIQRRRMHNASLLSLCKSHTLSYNAFFKYFMSMDGFAYNIKQNIIALDHPIFEYHCFATSTPCYDPITKTQSM